MQCAIQAIVIPGRCSIKFSCYLRVVRRRLPLFSVRREDAKQKRYTDYALSLMVHSRAAKFPKQQNTKKAL